MVKATRIAHTSSTISGFLEEVCFRLLGKKADLAADRRIEREEAETLALAEGLTYLEAWACSGNGFNAFLACLRKTRTDTTCNKKSRSCFRRFLAISE